MKTPVQDSPGNLESAARLLEAHADYRVLRRLDLAHAYPPLPAAASRGRACVLDTETTGTDPAADQMIELGIVVFDYDRETGQVGPVVAVFDGLEDPGRPIPPESTAIHGITDEMVAGRRLDEAEIARVMDGVGLVIAHNAAFDRRFVEARLPSFASLPWACSFREVPWRDAGGGSAALEFLAYRAGFFYEGHRAEIDCRALLEVLSRPLGQAADTALKVLLASARLPTHRIWANNSPFESKDLLRNRGYRWNAPLRCWSVDLTPDRVEAELAWLKTAVYGGRSVSVDVEIFDARTRYSTREGRRESART